MAISHSPVKAGPETIAGFSLGHVAGCAEVDDFDSKGPSGHHDVARLQVAVNDPQGAHVVQR